MLSGRLLSYLKKRKVSRNGHSLTLIVIRCHSLSFVVSLVVTRFTTRCHSLSLVVIRCHPMYHSLSLVVTRCTTRLSFYKRSKLCFEFLQKQSPRVVLFFRTFAKFIEKFAKIVNFAKFLRTPFLTEHLQWLLLQITSEYIQVQYPQNQRGYYRPFKLFKTVNILL